MFQTVQGLIPGRVISALCAIVIAGGCHQASAAIGCVNPIAGSICLATISAAVNAAAPGDTIEVAAGTYKEDVVINKSLSLIGAGSATTIIDATGLSNGIIVDGSAAAVSDVVITGFSVQNANFEGILVQNASSVTVSNNQVLNNNKSLDVANATCPGLPPAYQVGEAFDCGEGIHLSGVDHAVVSNNVVEHNSGGILISDDTGPTHDNLITGNLVTLNAVDCGITLASHSGMGVYHNTVAGNKSTSNGLGAPGAGAGVGIFAPGPGSQAYGNVVINNTLTGNGLPGVTMHNHASIPGAPPVKFDDNVIIGNTISGNAADTDDAATPGTTGINIYSVAPMNGTIVAENVISQEVIGIAFKAPGRLTAYLNNLAAQDGIFNFGSGTLSAPQNYWGCPGGPGTGGCSSAGGTVTTAPALTTPFSASTLPAAPGSGGSGGGGGGSPITIVVSGPGGVTGTTYEVISSQLTLSASQSASTNAGALTYVWTETAGYPSAAITAGNTSTAAFQLSRQGTYQFTLTVTDATGATATATITVKYV